MQHGKIRRVKRKIFSLIKTPETVIVVIDDVNKITFSLHQLVWTFRQFD